MNTATKRVCRLSGLILLVMLAGSAMAATRTGPVVVPDNGYATGYDYGSGWKCSFGYEEQRKACVAVAVPENGYISARGDSWSCERGYEQVEAQCRKISVPANGYLDGTAQRKWQCERGYQATRTACELIVIPANGYATNSSVGDPWKCERGYRGSGNECLRIAVPENGFLTKSSYGPGWQCERGYEAVNEQKCVKLEVPVNAHLDRSGNSWECNKPFRDRNGECVIIRL